MIIKSIGIENFQCYSGNLEQNKFEFRKGLMLLLVIMVLENQNFTMPFFGYSMIKSLILRQDN